MPKSEIGTVKWVSKQIKSKGLQKLRWYCQLCEKQCRDENGFRCHRMSDAHLRQMEVFEHNPKKIMNDYSKQFESAFMKLMRTRYSRTKVLANKVYNDLIHDRQHIHMNSTIWTTLTEFIHYLSDTNKCRIENSDKGWYIQYIDQEKIKREKELNKRKINQASEQEGFMRKAMENTSNFQRYETNILNRPTVLLRTDKEANESKISLEIKTRENLIKKTSFQSFFLDDREYTPKSIDSTICNLKLDNEKYGKRSSSLCREGY